MGFSIGSFLDECARKADPKTGETILYKSLYAFQGHIVGLDLAHLIRCFGYKVIVSNAKMLEVQKKLNPDVLPFLTLEELKTLEQDMEDIYQEEKTLMPCLLNRFFQYVCVLSSLRIYPIIVLDGCNPKHKEQEVVSRQNTKKRHQDELKEEIEKVAQFKQEVEEKKYTEEAEQKEKLAELLQKRNNLFCLEDKFMYPTEQIYANTLQLCSLLGLPVLSKKDVNFRYEADSILVKLFRDNICTAGAIANDHDIVLFGCPILADSYAEVRSILEHASLVSSSLSLPEKLNAHKDLIEEARKPTLLLSRGGKQKKEQERPPIEGWIRQTRPCDFESLLGLRMGDPMTWLSNFMGNDFCQGGLKSVGVKTALTLLKEACEKETKGETTFTDAVQHIISTHFESLWAKWWKTSEKELKQCLEACKELVCSCASSSSSACQFTCFFEKKQIWKRTLELFSFLSEQELQSLEQDEVQKYLVFDAFKSIVCNASKDPFQQQEIVFNWAKEKASIFFASQKKLFLKQAHRCISLATSLVCDCGCKLPTCYSELLVEPFRTWNQDPLKAFCQQHHMFSLFEEPTQEKEKAEFTFDDMCNLFETKIIHDPLYLTMWDKLQTM